MSALDFNGEMSAAFARAIACDPKFQQLGKLGCNRAALAQVGRGQWPIGSGRIETSPDGLFTPSEHGQPAYIQPVCDWDGDFGIADIVDLVAWRPSEPARWWWRVGTGFALGADLVDGDAPVLVVETPLAWLSAGGEALCILDWSISSPIWTRLRSAPPLTFTDDPLRERVRNHLIKSAPMPSMELQHAA